MTAVQIVLMVFGILVLVGGIQGTVWWLIFARLRRLPDVIRQECAASGERLLHEPERVHYSGATKGYSNVHGFAVLALTERRLICRHLGGSTTEVPLAQIAKVHAVESWTRQSRGGTRTSRRGGSRFLVVSTKEGADLGFAIKAETCEGWLAAFAPAVAQ